MIFAIIFPAFLLAQLSTPLNLNGQAIYRASCDGGITCTKTGSTLTIVGSGAAGGGGAGGAPVDGGFVVWTSVGSTNERLLSNGTNTTVDTATPGQIQVDLSGTIAQTLGGTGSGSTTCAAGEFLTSNGTTYSCSTPAGGSGASPLSLILGTP